MTSAFSIATIDADSGPRHYFMLAGVIVPFGIMLGPLCHWEKEIGEKLAAGVALKHKN